MKRTSRKKQPASSVESEAMARIVAEAALAMKAEDVVVLHVTEFVNFTDYFVIASGRSTRQAQAIGDNIIKTIYDQKSRPLGVEGESDGNWILVDWGGVVAHIFYHPVREFYDIEKLWGEAPKVEFKDPAGGRR